MSDLSDATKLLRAHLNSKSLYVPWIKLKIGDFVCDTADEKDNMFVSIQNIKNSGGLANKTTIVLAYVPSANVGIDNLGDDIDRIDMILACAGGENRKIKFQYGYAYPSIKSPEYEMMMLSYSVEIQNSVLLYTINCSSSLSKYANVTASIKEYTDKKPTEVFREVYNVFLKQEGYKLTFDENTEGTDNVVDVIPGANDVNIFEYLTSLLETATYENDKDDTKDTERSSYTWSINNSGNKIRVSRITPKSSNKKSSDRIVFNWMAGTDDIVLNFSTSFNGAVIASKAYSENFSTTHLFNLNEKGEANPYYGTLSPTTGPKVDSDYAVERYKWAKIATYGYKAQLQTIGIPAEYDILEEIQIIPLIYGKPHHTQGIYQITKITDTIDSSGFTTSWELIKKDSEEVEKYYQDGYNNDAITKAKESGIADYYNSKEVEKGKQYGNGGSGGGISTTASGLRGKVVQIAQSQMEGKSGEVYWNYVFGGGFVNGNATPWCACFVSWCGGQAGAWGGYKSGACIQFKQHFEQQGMWQKGKAHGGNYNPQAGDLIIFNWSGVYGGSCNHIGIVESFDGSKVHTLEGNSSNATHRRSYDVNASVIVGYCLY